MDAETNFLPNLPSSPLVCEANSTASSPRPRCTCGFLLCSDCPTLTRISCPRIGWSRRCASERHSDSSLQDENLYVRPKICCITITALQIFWKSSKSWSLFLSTLKVKKSLTRRQNFFEVQAVEIRYSDIIFLGISEEYFTGEKWGTNS